MHRRVAEGDMAAIKDYIMDMLEAVPKGRKLRPFWRRPLFL
ncbi:hypothetical protein B4135_3016 [Caldibacillus debilis]|uniref:Uncharacterized protein n=1 Tax=Caldibacillus debilis TaxID=301148 RepID=A0A150LKH3_9BACI|nr:hypothetical protein B4135_3016 [Caldibacillus debilis]